MPYRMGPAGWGYHPFGYDRGWCWHPGWYGASVPPWGPPTKEEEANFLRDELSQIEKRLEELKK